MVHLNHSLCSVLYPDGPSFGGSQMFASEEKLVRYGCGVVAAQELLLYLCRYHCGNGERLFSDELLSSSPVSREAYDISLRRINRDFILVIPGIGVNGIGLFAGLNAAFHRFRLPYSARWAISSRSFYPSMEKMLLQDIPVIFSVGPNFPVLWGRRKVGLRSEQSSRQEAVLPVNAHYMIAVGLDDESIHVSSWGRPFAIRREEYDQYVRRFSSSIVSNLLFVSPR